jgi:hypothetical protein
MPPIEEASIDEEVQPMDEEVHQLKKRTREEVQFKRRCMIDNKPCQHFKRFKRVRVLTTFGVTK